MFDGAYVNWNHARVKAIIDHYGARSLYWKAVLDLGSGVGDIAIALSRLGAEVTCVEARQEHLDILKKKYHNLKTQRADLDNEWPFAKKKFDFVIDMGLLCHLKNWKLHLAQVCSVANYLVLETEVCDSDDPEKEFIVEESKSVYDWSFNGLGSRPSANAIEKELTANGFTFKRHDSPKLNSGPYKYDWKVQNTGDRKFGFRRMWFCKKAGQPSEESKTLLKENRNTKVDILLPPEPGKETPLIHNKPVAKTFPHHISNASVSEDYRTTSKDFAILQPENFISPTKFDLSASILPLTNSSKNWFKKIYNFFPNLTVNKKALTMYNFNTSNTEPDIVICSINNILPAKRVFIEEWANHSFTADNIAALKNCGQILTPSLVNAQEILAALPNSNVSRISKPWPMLNVQSFRDEYFIYFEKDVNLTKILLDSWMMSFGKLMVVGSGVKLPEFAEYISDCQDYPTLLSRLYGAKAIIDLNNNNYYMSGILDLAKAANIPIITNNNHFSSENSITLLNQQNIRAPIHKISKNKSNFNPKYNSNYNNILLNNLKIMLGKNA